MQKVYLTLLILCFGLCGIYANDPESLKTAFGDHFRIGVALNHKTIEKSNPAHLQLIQREFNSIVAENCMKSEWVQPREGHFTFDKADNFMAFGEKHKMLIIGHTLVWHSQAPDWMFTDDKGNTVSRELLIERMRKHIHTLVGRYKGRVHGWDVVNEAILNNGEFRKSKWHEIIGPEYIEMAFQFAHEADPNAELYYNDYGMDSPGKRNTVVQMVQKLKAKGIRIDGIGMQAHYDLNLSLKEFENSLAAFAETGLKVMITELDITVLPFPSERITADVSTKHEYQNKYNPYKKGLPADVQAKQTEIYKCIFTILLKYSDHVSRVTFWGLNDAITWKNNWPVRGRTDYPLLFDRDSKPKPAYDEIIELAKQH